MAIKISSNQDFGGVSKAINLADGTVASDGINKGQLDAAAALKQDIVSGGSGIIISGTSLAVDLSTSGVAYESMVISGLALNSLNGTYTRLPNNGHFNDIGPAQLDYTHNAGEYAMFYKDNGSGVYGLIGMQDGDGLNTSGAGYWWTATLVTVDPTTFSSNISAIVPDLNAVDFTTVANGSEQDENSNFVPNDIYSNVSYLTGSSSSGMKFDNNKLGIDFASTIGASASTKVFPSSVIKTYVDEQIVSAKDLSNHPFSNTVAQIIGSPTNAQSMGEALASEIDTLDGQVSALQTKDANHDAFLIDHTSALGLSQGDDDMGEYTTPFVTDNSNQRAINEQLGGAFSTVYQNLGTITGLAAFATDFGDGFTILPNDSDAKSMFQATESELQAISLGLGQFWSPVEAHEDSNIVISNPATDEFGGATVVNGDRVLLLGQTAASQNGIYIFNGSGSAMTRDTDADASSEFTPNKTVQVLNSSEDGISGATFAYGGIDSPTVGTNVLPFTLKSKGVVGDNTITEAKLATALATKLNTKVDKFKETGITLVANVAYTVNHNLGEDIVIYSVYDSSNNEMQLEVDIVDNNNLTIKSTSAESGVKIAVV